MFSKSLNELASQYLRELFVRNSRCPACNLRKTGTNIRLPKKRSNNGQRCFSYRGAKLWNSLSAKSKRAFSLYSFKENYLERRIPFVLWFIAYFLLIFLHLVLIIGINDILFDVT